MSSSSHPTNSLKRTASTLSTDKTARRHRSNSSSSAEVEGGFKRSTQEGSQGSPRSDVVAPARSWRAINKPWPPLPDDNSSTRASIGGSGMTAATVAEQSRTERTSGPISEDRNVHDVSESGEDSGPSRVAMASEDISLADTGHLSIADKETLFETPAEGYDIVEVRARFVPEAFWSELLELSQKQYMEIDAAWSGVLGLREGRPERSRNGAYYYCLHPTCKAQHGKQWDALVGHMKTNHLKRAQQWANAKDSDWQCAVCQAVFLGKTPYKHCREHVKDQHRKELKTEIKNVEDFMIHKQPEPRPREEGENATEEMTH